MKNLLQFNEQFWNKSLLTLAEMSARGIALDVSYLTRMLGIAEEKVSILGRELDVWAADYLRQLDKPEMNWNSPAQKAEFLYVFKSYPISPVKGSLSAVTRNTKREPTSSAAAIDWLANNTKSSTDSSYLRKLAELGKYRTKIGYINSWLTLVSADGRLRSNFKPAADTGRLTSGNPNLQNVASRGDKLTLRKGFVAAPGKLLIVADYSQLEVYVMAHFLLQYFNDPVLADMLASEDIHTNMAFRVWGDQLNSLGATPELYAAERAAGFENHPSWKVFRDNAKTTIYSAAYGKTAAGLGSQLMDVNGRAIGKKAAQGVLDDFYEGIPSLDRLFERWRSEARETGYVRTLLGRTRPLPRSASDNVWERRSSDRQAVNSPVQGSAADIVTTAMVRCVGSLPTLDGFDRPRAELVLQVHDELVFECDASIAEAECAKIKAIMENPFKSPLKLQLRVDANVGANWYEGK